jgi:hypothetical protein
VNSLNLAANMTRMVEFADVEEFDTWRLESPPSRRIHQILFTTVILVVYTES